MLQHSFQKLRDTVFISFSMNCSFDVLYTCCHLTINEGTQVAQLPTVYFQFLEAYISI